MLQIIEYFNVITWIDTMASESKEWVNAHHRSYNSKSGGVFVYVDSVTLRFSGIPIDKPLQVKRYPTKEGKVILKFRVKKDEQKDEQKED